MHRAAVSFLLFLPVLAHAGSPVSFRNDVMAVLSRAGCNSGACHGNLNGKGGFKLSLRGENPDADFAALTRDMLGRRLDRHRPVDSLVLAKATMFLPHEGGPRFRRDSLEYQILHHWIAAGAPLDSASTPRPVRLQATPATAVLHDPSDRVRIEVRATFSDGTTRDVSRLACFEPSTLLVKVDPSGLVVRQGYGETVLLVRYLDQQAVVRLAFVPPRPDFVWKEVPIHNDIDRLVFTKLKSLRIQPAGLCDDSEFLRRAYLDTLGLLPTPAETRRFLADNRPDKRGRLIAQLVERNEFADFWALKWADLLRNEEKVLDTTGVQLFHGWLRQAIIDGKPLNEFARELIASRGSTYRHPAANYYRALRDPYTRAEATAQVFLGIRLQCARCHNHPFDRWTQTDYHRFSAFFNRVQYRIIENNRRDRLDTHEFAGEQIVWMARAGELTHPVSGENLTPRFLGGDTPGANADRLRALADWVAHPDNPYFARAQVNRIWQHLVGKGIVDPGDDFRDSNPASNPELLDALTKEFVARQFDLRHMLRMILNSRVYQLSARPNKSNRDEESKSNFARAIVRPLQAEQLLDAMVQVTGAPLRFGGFPTRTRAGQLPGVGANRRRGLGAGDGDKFLSIFGKPVRSLSCECERSDDTTLARAFQLISGPTINRLIADENNRLTKLVAAGKSDAAIIEELFLAALCRLPSDREKQKTMELLVQSADRRATLEDILWGLLNAKEFLLRR
jgi:hypothetical protein